jgi:hypothetical protein
MLLRRLASASTLEATVALLAEARRDAADERFAA